jgi:hypothetical protein
MPYLSSDFSLLPSTLLHAIMEQQQVNSNSVPLLSDAAA